MTMRIGRVGKVSCACPTSERANNPSNAAATALICRNLIASSLLISCAACARICRQDAGNRLSQQGHGFFATRNDLDTAHALAGLVSTAMIPGKRRQERPLTSGRRFDERDPG